MNIESLTETLDLLENSRIAEIEIESEDGANYLKIRRTPKPKPVVGPITSGPDSTAEAIPKVSEVAGNWVGRFHPAEESAVVGQIVEEDEILGMIETMRVMNPVSSPVNGRILAVHIEDGQSVQYGQLLFEISPE
jgi:acetyl-CoA carboxylase biotin carboxyl carrier protein